MKKHLLTGFVVLLPITLTLMIIIFLFDLFTEPFFWIVGPLIDWVQSLLNISMPHGITLFLSRLLSLIFLCIFIFFLGMVTQLFLVRSLINIGHILILRIPFINTVYKLSRDIFEAVFAQDGKKAFKCPVMVPFPCKPTECLGFEVGEMAQEVSEKLKIPLAPVFLPTAPHPISGFLFFIPEEDIHRVNMSNEAALKHLVSGGMIVPESEIIPEPDDDE